MLSCRRITAWLLAVIFLLLTFSTALADGSAESVNAKAESSFEGCALIGDSISDGLRLYTMQQRKKDPSFLDGLTFLTVTSYNLKYASSLKPKKYLKCNGKSMRPQDALKAMEADTVFIMLGMNDIFRDFEDSIARYETLITNIRASNPEIEICILGITPVVSGKERSGFTNARVDQFNVLLMQMAAAQGCHFAGFTALLRDESGGLKREYSNDKFVHLKGDAFVIYASALQSALSIIKKEAAAPDTFSCLTGDFQSLYQS